MVGEWEVMGGLTSRHRLKATGVYGFDWDAKVNEKSEGLRNQKHFFRIEEATLNYYWSPQKFKSRISFAIKRNSWHRL